MCNRSQSRTNSSCSSNVSSCRWSRYPQHILLIVTLLCCTCAVEAIDLSAMHPLSPDTPGICTADIQSSGPLTPATGGKEEQEKMRQLVFTAYDQQAQGRYQGDTTYLVTHYGGDGIAMINLVPNLTPERRAELMRTGPVKPALRKIRFAYKGEKLRCDAKTLSPDKIIAPGEEYQASYTGECTYAYFPYGNDGKGPVGYIEPEKRLPFSSGLLISEWSMRTFSNHDIRDFLANSQLEYVGKQRVGDADCLKFSRPNNNNTSLVELWFSINDGMQLKRIARSTNTQSRKPGFDGYPANVYGTKTIRDIESYYTYEGYAIPATGKFLDIAFGRDEECVSIMSVDTWSLQSYDPTVEDAVFSVAPTPADGLFPSRIFPLGTMIYDVVHKRMYYDGDPITTEEKE